MDPLSIAASVVALLTATEQVVSYVRLTKDAPKEQMKIYREALSLKGFLTGLKTLIDEAQRDPQNPWLHTIAKLGLPDGAFVQCTLALDALLLKVTQGVGIQKTVQRMTWKFSKAEVDATLSQIERVKTLVGIALEMDHLSMTRAIQADVQKIHKSIADLESNTTTVKYTTTNIKSDTGALLDDTVVQHKAKLMKCICSVDYHVQHKDFIKPHQTGTGRWFVEDPKFEAWKRSKNTTLFCPGVPGAGKTTMAALIIDHLQSQHTDKEPVTFIYCDYKRQSEQSAEHMLSALLRQIIESQPAVPKDVQDSYITPTGKEVTPSWEKVKQILGTASKNLHALTVVIDALDECERKAREDFLTAVEDLRKQCDIRLLATSRFVPIIENRSSFLGRPTLEIKASDEDLGKYIRSRACEPASNLQRILSKPNGPKLLEDLVSETTKATGGMFLLAKLFMDSFQDKLTPKQVKLALENLPKGSDAYDKAYRGALERIFAQGEGSSAMARRILAWILCARRPLSTLELRHALAIEPGDTELDEDNFLETGELLDLCGGLVTHDEQSDNVRFIHYTTQEYLQRMQQTWLPHANIEVARSCIAYLSIDSFAVAQATHEDYRARVEQFVLLRYAAMHWNLHLSMITDTSSMVELDEVFDAAFSLVVSVKRLGAINQIHQYETVRPANNIVLTAVDEVLSCHWIASFGLVPLLERWINAKYGVDQPDSRGRTPLSWAAGFGHRAIVERLLDTGKVDVDLKDNLHMTPLLWAAWRGHETTVKQLLDTGKVDVDQKDNEHRTILSHAAQNGHETTVRQLLDTGKVDADSKSIRGRTPLSYAAEYGHEAVVERLLETKKVDVNSRGDGGRTSLSLAARYPVEAKGNIIVKQLLDTGKVDTDSKNRALLDAAGFGREEMVEQLLNMNATITREVLKAAAGCSGIRGRQQLQLLLDARDVRGDDPKDTVQILKDIEHWSPSFGEEDRQELEQRMTMIAERARKIACSGSFPGYQRLSDRVGRLKFSFNWYYTHGQQPNPVVTQ